MAIRVERKEAKFKDIADYPWEEWTDGKPWKAKQGVDFTCSISSFRSALHRHAGRSNGRLECRTTTEGKFVTFRFVRIPKSKRAKNAT